MEGEVLILAYALPIRLNLWDFKGLNIWQREGNRHINHMPRELYLTATERVRENEEACVKL